MICHSFISIQP